MFRICIYSFANPRNEGDYDDNEGGRERGRNCIEIERRKKVNGREVFMCMQVRREYGKRRDCEI